MECRITLAMNLNYHNLFEIIVSELVIKDELRTRQEKLITIEFRPWTAHCTVHTSTKGRP